MSESNGFHITGGQGGELPRSSLAMIEVAINRGYPISEEMRKAIIDKAFETIKTSKKLRAIFGACKVLLAADMINVRRESLEIENRKADAIESTALLREVMANPEARKLLSQLSVHICAEPIEDEQKSA